MLNVEKKQQMLAQFSDYLDTLPVEPDDASQTAPSEVDLFSLFTELAALKTEVKIESRQVKSAIEEFQGLTELLQNNNTQLSNELADRRQQQQLDQQKIEKPFLLALLDMRDRFEAGLMQSQVYQPGWLARRDTVTQQHIESLHQAMEISLRRLDVLLDRYSVKPIIAVGMPLDPHFMQVSATANSPDTDDGIVMLETRKGYLRDGQLLRLAEVTVNKINRDIS